MLNWVFLFFAGCCEVVWAVALKYSDSFTRPIPAIVTVVGMTASVVLLGLAVRTLPIGTSYAVWTGIGSVGTAILGIILFHDPTSFWRLFFLCGIIVCITGLFVVSKT